MAPGRLTVVDSSVWIDFLNGTQTWQATKLDGLIEEDQRVCLIDLILVEVLRGLRDDQQADEIAQGLLGFPFLEPVVPSDHLKAAQLYRSARSAGITVAGTVDLVISAICIRHRAVLLHADRDFDRLSTVTDLEVWPAPD